jgi:hypothetical protein
MLDIHVRTSIRTGIQDNVKDFCCIPSSTFDAHMALLRNQFDLNSIKYTEGEDKRKYENMSQYNDSKVKQGVIFIWYLPRCLELFLDPSFQALKVTKS